MENILRFFRSFPIEDAMMVIPLSILLGLLSYMLMGKKRWCLSIMFGLMSFAVMHLGMSLAFPAILIMSLFYMHELGCRSIFPLVTMLVLTVLTFLMGLNFRYAVLLSLIFTLIISIVKRAKFRYALFFALSIAVAVLTSNPAAYIPIMLGMVACERRSFRVMSFDRFKKMYLKHDVANYEYMVLSLFTDEVEKLSPNEDEEICNFLGLMCGSGVVSQMDPFTYVVAFSDIKKSFGMSIPKVKTERENDMMTLEDAESN